MFANVYKLTTIFSYAYQMIQYIEQEKHKLDQITARNLRMSLDKRIAFSK